MVKRMMAISAMAAALLAVFPVRDAAQPDGGDCAALKNLITESMD